MFRELVFVFVLLAYPFLILTRSLDGRAHLIYYILITGCTAVIIRHIDKLIKKIDELIKKDKQI